MKILQTCPSCSKFRFFIKRWNYTHFMTGNMRDKYENQKCYYCARALQKGYDEMEVKIKHDNS